MKFFCLIFLIVTFTPANAFSIDANSRSTKGEKEKTQLMQNLRGNGLCFTPNKGQLADTDGKLCPDVLYKGEGNGADIYLRKTGISYVYSNAGEVMHDIDEQIEELEHSGNSDILTVQQKKQELMQQQNIKLHRVDMDFEGCLPAKASANENGKTTTTINEFELEGYQNFYYAHCPEGITNVRQYNKVTYKNIYNNIDIAFYGDKQNGIKYDLIVQPHTDPNQIKLHWKGAESIHINREGNLVIKTSVNEFTESIPKVYQNINGKIVDVPTKYVLTLSPSGRAGEGFINFSFSIFNFQFFIPFSNRPMGHLLWGN